MYNTPIISIVAASSNTGKTTFLEKLIKELIQRGLKIGTIKTDAHSFEMDKPGKDTWRHTQAGAKATAIISHSRYALIQQTEETKDLDQVANMLEDVDLILIEGCKRGDKPKIEVVRREKGIKLISPADDLIAVVTDVDELEVTAPKFDINDARAVADYLVNDYLKSLNAQPETTGLTHFDEQGRAYMVDVTEKATTTREAIAKGEILMAAETLELIMQGKMAKGDVLAVAQVAGIMAVKETSRLIPMCHPLIIGSVKIDFAFDKVNSKVEIECRVKISGQTGVEMEALTGVNIAALTIYDMCKAVDKNMVINNVRLERKTGGKSGTFIRRER